MIVLCCMGVLLGAALVGYVWEKNARMTMQEEMAGLLMESESLERERGELNDRLSELERKYQEQEAHDLEISALPLSETEHREILQKRYISGKGMTAYKVPGEVETLKCEESISDR